MILDFRDILELVVAPVYTDKTTVYLEGKIHDQSQQYLEFLAHIKLPTKTSLFRAVCSKCTVGGEI